MFINKSVSLGSGLVMAIFGLVLLAFPAFTMSFFTVLVGIAFLTAGATSLFTWFTLVRATGFGWGTLVFGVLSIIFALVCFVHPFALASTVTWLVALCVVIAGIAQIVAIASTPKAPGRALAIAGSVIVTLFGVFALVWPPMVVQFVGISLIIEGITAIVVGIAARPIDVDPF